MTDWLSRNWRWLAVTLVALSGWAVSACNAWRAGEPIPHPPPVVIPAEAGDQPKE